MREGAWPISLLALALCSEAAGTVEAMDGCRAILKGRHTRYEGREDPRRPAVGWPMEWKFRMTASGEVVSEGLGYCQERFNLRWHKNP